MKKAFTLIELIIILSLIMIFSTLSLAAYNNYNEQVKLKTEAKKLAQVIDLAKKKAYSSDLYQACSNFLGYQVTVGAASYSLRFNCGGSYQTVQGYSFDGKVSVVSGIGSLNFPPLGLNTNITINSIRLKNSMTNQCLDISVSPIGVVEVNETLISC